MTEVPATPENRPPPPKPRKSGVIVPHTAPWSQRFGAWLVFAFLRTLARSLRYRWSDPHHALEHPPTGPIIFCVWHNRLALCLEAYRYFKSRCPRIGMAAIVSASKDGGFLAEILKCFKVQPVRGSSSRRGAQALLELTSWGERGYDLAVTPDGPRGPRYVVQDGVIAAAQVTGLPIIPASYHLQWKIRLKSWDGFQIPVPFSRCEMNVGAPIRIPRDATDAEREALRRQLEQTLKELSRD